MNSWAEAALHPSKSPMAPGLVLGSCSTGICDINTEKKKKKMNVSINYFGTKGFC
jgi:hypothetical protein